jgi:signal transduction histidine kinase
VSLRLLESQWRDRITVHRNLGELPLVECDAGQINQVIMNVLGNACEAIPAAGNIWVTTRDERSQVVIEIRDDGRGIAPDVLPHVFDPFFTTKDVGDGTGLGLAISQGIVAAHHGQMDVESEPGTGTVFRIALPVSSGQASLDKTATGG